MNTYELAYEAGKDQGIEDERKRIIKALEDPIAKNKELLKSRTDTRIMWTVNAYQEIVDWLKLEIEGESNVQNLQENRNNDP